ncbi:uncharacterized protein F5147DRAFT_771601 [Suillus discolor]|uniref:Uncharacterized protein n=1 Tax=Suillus discolor TaxID=1912936 RepID=A0A9P7FC39_9AGAM|nr:uncharacterized protein F5147DRAFT_771601 [Suillus discolor]KAG2112038.1 hypothetical protein F5147DRAFT_771601 [Suillus discolor]
MTMLAKHDKSLYKITEKKRYTFKYLPGASRSNNEILLIQVIDYSHTEAMDVTNKNDYVEMAKNIEKLPVHTHKGNDYDNSVIYVHLSGMEIPCTPVMVKDWARAMYDGEAMTSMPPNIQSFNPAKQEPVLHLMYHAALTTPMVPPVPSTVSASDISSLDSMLLLRTIQDLAHNQDHAAISSTPLPTVNTSVLACSPVILTPSKLTCFLKYAEQELGVTHVTVYESSLGSIGAGPDILAEIADHELTHIGLTLGDIICLKKGSVT